MDGTTVGVRPPTVECLRRSPEFDDVTELFITHVTDPARELLVREGDRIRKDQLLAWLIWKEPDLARNRQRAEAVLQETEAALALAVRKVRLARALVRAQLSVADAVAREEAALLHAQEVLAQARRELQCLAEEAQRTAEVRAPVTERGSHR